MGALARQASTVNPSGMMESPRQECGLWSQFGSPEALDPGDGKTMGLLFSVGHFSALFSECLSIRGRHDSRPPLGKQGPGGKRGRFLVSVEVGGMIPTVP